MTSIQSPFNNPDYKDLSDFMGEYSDSSGSLNRLKRLFEDSNYSFGYRCKILLQSKDHSEILGVSSVIEGQHFTIAVRAMDPGFGSYCNESRMIYYSVYFPYMRLVAFININAKNPYTPSYSSAFVFASTDGADWAPLTTLHIYGGEMSGCGGYMGDVRRSNKDLFKDLVNSTAESDEQIYLANQAADLLVNQYLISRFQYTYFTVWSSWFPLIVQSTAMSERLIDKAVSDRLDNSDEVFLPENIERLKEVARTRIAETDIHCIRSLCPHSFAEQWERLSPDDINSHLSLYTESAKSIKWFKIFKDSPNTINGNELASSVLDSFASDEVEYDDSYLPF